MIVTQKVRSADDNRELDSGNRRDNMCSIGPLSSAADGTMGYSAMTC
jgi:hypothetical protein